jgi:hypothetical protein
LQFQEPHTTWHDAVSHHKRLECTQFKCHAEHNCVLCHGTCDFCHWPVTTESWVQFQASPCEICVDKVALREVFLQVLQFSRVSYHLTPLTRSIHILFIFDWCCMLTW